MYSRGVRPDGTIAGGATAVANTSQMETNPRLTADLIIYQRQNSGTGYDLYARLLDNSGLPAGEPFVIQETAGNQQNPAMAAGSNQRYQLAWQDDATGPWDLFTASLDRRYQVTHIEYEYDPLYRLTKAEYSGDISAGYTYIYDAVGNMTAYEETVNGQTSSVSRTFNAANQLVSSTDTELGTSSFTYDDNGNLVEFREPLHPIPSMMYFYNQRNLLVKVEQPVDHAPNRPIADYVYDGDGNRLQQVDHTDITPVTTTYTNDIIGLSQVLVSSNGTTTTYNLFGLDLISQDDGTETRFMLADGLGSVRVEMVDNVVETTTTYEPYGKLLAQTGSSGTVYGFTGEQHDAATGLVYLRARYYNPSLKLFMSRDPFPGIPTMPASQHGYSYVHNNPVNMVDPTGKCSEPVSGTVCVVVAGVAVVVVVVVVYVALPLLIKAGQAMVELAGDIWDRCIIALAPPKTQPQTVTQIRTETVVVPNSQPQPRLTPHPPPLPDFPTPTPRSDHIFYFADVGPYFSPGRDTNQLVSYLSDYENTISGVWGVRTQLERAQEQYNLRGGDFRANDLMGRKFEAERVIFYADRAALGSANSTAKGVDLFPVNFGSIQYIQVRWTASSLSLSTIQTVAARARTFPSGTYLLESNSIDAQSRKWLEERGGRQLPSSIMLP